MSSVTFSSSYASRSFEPLLSRCESSLWIQALNLVKDKRNEEAGLVLKAFDRLRAWVLLLAWDSFEGYVRSY